MYTEERPWGKFSTLQKGDGYKVKCIEINPGQSISLQYHKDRYEDWIIVGGGGVVCNGDKTRNCIVGDRFHIAPMKIHRATGGPNGLKFIEVQRGSCDENDIVRLEDSYGRVV
jgi:mannose-1-phosphate guanylyltransferase/mannose-6-phosphate isomerase